MRISEMPIVMLRCLVITLVIECLIAIILGYRKRDLLNVFLVNVLTNPLVNSISIAINYHYGLKYRNIALIILEALAFLVEGFIYFKCLRKRKINGFILSLILNLGSYLTGLLVNYLIY